MILVIVALILTGGGIYLLVKKNLESGAGMIVGGIFAAAFAITAVICGAMTYPTLTGARAEAIALKSEIATVQAAYYKDIVRDNQFIGGSLDNMKQSTILSEYIESYAKRKAHYNRTLTEAKAFKETWLIRWLWHGFFISNKVFELELL